jgi:ADP-heptose:LPS heptosyltransferase
MSVRHVVRDRQGREQVAHLPQVPGNCPAPEDRLTLITQEQLASATSLAIRRDCGLGDLLMLTPIFRALGQLCPNLKTDLYCHERFHHLFENNPFVTAQPFADYKSQAPKHDLQADLVAWEAKSPLRDCLDRTSIFAKAFGIVFDGESGFPDYFVSAEEDDAAVTALADCPRPWVAIAPVASQQLRTWTDDGLAVLTRGLLEHGGTVFPVHHTRDLANASYFQHERVRPQWGVDLRHLAALLAHMDTVVSVDTGPFHLAAAASGYSAQVPLVLLFGNVLADIRLRWYRRDRCVVVQESGACPHFPCDATGAKCNRDDNGNYPCMAAISGQQVLDAVLKGLKQ